MIEIRNNQYRTVDQKIAFLIGIILLLLMLIIVVAASYMFNALQKDAEDNLSIGIAITISESINRVSFSGKYHTRALVEDMKDKVKELAYVAVHSRNGLVFAHSEKIKNDLPVSEVEKTEDLLCIKLDKPMVYERRSLGLIINEVRMPFYGGLDNEILGVVRVGINLSEQRKARLVSLYKLFLLVLFLTLASIIIIYKIIRHFGKSIRYLANHLQGILDHAPIGIIVSNEKNEITLLSKETDNFFPNAKNVVFMSDLTDFLPSDSLGESYIELKEVISGEQKCLDKELEFLDEDKSHRCWQISKFPIAIDSQGHAQLICAFIRDISGKRMAETLLKESEETFRRLFNLSADPIMILNERKFVECNEATLKMLGGMKREDLIGSSLKDISPEFQENGLKVFDYEKKLYSEAMEKGNIRFEWCHLKIDGTRFFVDVSMTPIIIKGEVFLHVIWRDITEYKKSAEEREKLQIQLFQAQKMDAIGQLAGGIAHDFNNILTGIIGSIELLKVEKNLQEKKDLYLDMILKSTSRAAELTNNLLAFARKGNKKEKLVDVIQVIQDAINILSSTIDKRISISLEDFSNSAIIRGDQTLLQNVFLNMGINASHAMENGGNLDFKVRNVALESSYCSSSPFQIEPGNYVEIEVCDNGSGMTLEIQKRIFEPFFTTKDSGKGTGLGLSVAYGTIQAHHGALSVYSEVGKGTVFHVYLPLSEKVAIEQGEEKPQLIQGSGKILLVDDEELIRVATKNMLEFIGYEVFLAENGEEALELLENLNHQIDLIILDMLMPVMGGKETLEKISETSYKGKIIVASGFSKDDQLSDIAENHVCSFIHKPFRLAELSQLIAKNLET